LAGVVVVVGAPDAPVEVCAMTLFELTPQEVATMALGIALAVLLATAI
jgi:sugar (pentulose or hexulose) kinase